MRQIKAFIASAILTAIVLALPVFALYGVLTVDNAGGYEQEEKSIELNSDTLEISVFDTDFVIDFDYCKNALEIAGKWVLLWI